MMERSFKVLNCQVLVVFFVLLSNLSCDHVDNRFSAQKFTNTQWSEEEKRLPVARRLLNESSSEKSFIVRLNESEKPHTHDQRLDVEVIKGEAFLHMKNKKQLMRPGDKVSIPAHAMHWAELIDGNSVEVLATFVAE